MTRRRSSETDLPLLRWGDEIRARKMRRRQHRLLLATGLPIGLLLSTLASPPPLRLVWNATASAPIGLYHVIDAPLHRGDMVVAWLPEPFRELAARRRYLPANVPLVKRIAGVPGDEVCALDRTIFLNGAPVAVRRKVDGQHRPMPAWSGCHVLASGELFLLMPAANSFDGRYFGTTKSSYVLGKAIPLWVR